MYRLLFLLIILVSCKQETREGNSAQFNSDSLINAQLNLLSKLDLSLKKVGHVNSTGSSIEVSADSVNWANELEPFRIISLINRPIYASAYSVSVEQDTKSNLTIKSWVAKSEVPLKELKVYFLNNLDKIKKIEATLEVANFIFTTNKDLQIEFSALGHSAHPETYKISGYQKFLWGKPNYFSIEGLIQVK